MLLFPHISVSRRPSGSGKSRMASCPLASSLPVVRADPLLTTVQSPYTLEGAGFAIQLDAHGYAVRKWLLDWGDEITQVVAPADGSPTTVASHTYADDGTYEIKVSVADERGTFAAEPVSLEVRDAAATVSVAALEGGKGGILLKTVRQAWHRPLKSRKSRMSPFPFPHFQPINSGTLANKGTNDSPFISY